MGNLGDSMGRVFTCLLVTHANILSSIRSTELFNSASLLNGMLSYRAVSFLTSRNEIKNETAPAASVTYFAPLNFRRTVTSTSELLRFL